MKAGDYFWIFDLRGDDGGAIQNEQSASPC